MNSVSVVIPTLNGGPLFEQVLQQLTRQVCPVPIEILVVDSGSTDGTIEAAKKAGARVENVPRQDFDHGLTRNKGIEMTSGDVVVLLTQDALPADEHLIANLLKVFNRPEV